MGTTGWLKRVALRSVTLGTLGMALLLGGCGVGFQPSSVSSPHGSRVKAAQTAAVFPTEPGFVWQYDVLAHPSDDPDVDYHGTETVRIVSSRKQDGAVMVECKAIDTFTSRYRFPQLVVTGDKVIMRGVTYWGSAASEAEGLSIAFLQLPLTVGARWDDGEWIGEVEAREKVTVPTGTYDAFRVNVIGTHDDVYTAVGDYWVAPGVGIVKSDLSIPGWNIESELIVAGVQR
jgi:hypothetical protein